MIKTVEGIYQDGEIHLTQLPQDISDRSQVLVTFLDPGKIDLLAIANNPNKVQAEIIYSMTFVTINSYD